MIIVMESQLKEVDVYPWPFIYVCFNMETDVYIINIDTQ